MIIDDALSDQAVLTELGERLSRRRIDRSLTQAELAREAGVSKRTVERSEAGESVQLGNFIRILRVLDLLPNLDSAIPAPQPRPMDLLRRGGRQRQRASGQVSDGERKAWQWADDDAG